MCLDFNWELIFIFYVTQDAGEVYGERSILSTEVTELENRLLNLSEDRDKSLSVLHEVCATVQVARLENFLSISVLFH